jgi:hypothetical protein
MLLLQRNPSALVHKPKPLADTVLKLQELKSKVPRWSGRRDRGVSEELVLLRYALHCGARTVSRMNYLLEKGLQEQVREYKRPASLYKMRCSHSSITTS